MVKAGLVAEVKKMSRKKLSKTASMALGLSEVQTYLKGQSTLPQALDLLKQHTRNYAKRQLSWFRHEKDVRMIPVAVDEAPKATPLKY
jgi:tRNA dimethylallyltransferase